MIDEAQSLVENHPLRALDALHIASAQVFQRQLKLPVLFISADSRQLAAAKREGLTVKAIA